MSTRRGGYVYGGEITDAGGLDLIAVNEAIMTRRTRRSRGPVLPGEHGTEAGYHRHRKAGETACEACRAAARRAEAARRRARLAIDPKDA